MVRCGAIGAVRAFGKTRTLEVRHNGLMELSDVVSLIRENPLLVAATVSALSTPESALVETAITEEGVMVYGSQEKTRKIDNLRQNPAVALMAWNQDYSHSVQIDGTGMLVDEAHRAWAEELFFGQFPDKAGKPGFVLVVMRPTWVRWVDRSQPGLPQMQQVSLA